MEPLLALAVPQWIETLKTKSFEDFEKRREAILESVCYKGDLLLYGSKKKGETAKLFNDLAEGLAWLALIAEGGVSFGEQHWDAEFEKVPDVQGDPAGCTRQSEAMSEMRTRTNHAAAVHNDEGADKKGETDDRRDG